MAGPFWAIFGVALLLAAAGLYRMGGIPERHATDDESGFLPGDHLISSISPRDAAWLVAGVGLFFILLFVLGL